MEGADVGEDGPVTKVTCVVEPEPSAVIGAWVLAQSLKGISDGAVEFGLTVVKRQGAEEWILDRAVQLGIRARSCLSPHENPYLNKWLWIEAFPEWHDARHLAMLDGDMLLVSQRALPGPVDGRIAARPNPPTLYEDLVRELPPGLFPSGVVEGHGRVPSSLNGGLLISTAALLRQCAPLVAGFEAAIGAAAKKAAHWEREQLALSAAVGQLGFARLPSSWNVTWRYRNLRQKVNLWHYSSASGTMMELKRTLDRPAIALGCLRELRQTYPEAVACFLGYYSRAIEQRWFNELIRQHRPQHVSALPSRHSAAPSSSVEARH